MTRGERKLREKLTGKNRFPGDNSSKKMLFGATLRAPVPRAVIEDIEIPPVPDDVILVTAQDIPGRNLLTLEGQSTPLLCRDQIDYQGQPILLAAAAEPRRAREFLGQVSLVLNQQPPLPTLPKAGEDQIIYQRNTARGPQGDKWEELFAEAAHVVEGVYETSSQTPGAALLASATASRDGQRLFGTINSQWPHHVRRTVSDALGIPLKKVLLRNTTVEESADSKTVLPALVTAHAALLSWKSRQPVQMIYTAQEDFLMTPMRPGCRIRYKTAHNEEGQFLAADVDIQVEGGGASFFCEEMADRMVLAALGPYRCRNQRVSCRFYRTSHPPRGPVKSMGEEMVFFALEDHTARIARRLDQGRAEWKRRNFLFPESRTASGADLGSPDALAILMEETCRRSDYHRKQAAYELLRKQNYPRRGGTDPLRGIGLAVAYQGTGFLRRPGPTATAAVELTMDTTGKLTIKISAMPDHSALSAIWAKQAALTLGIEDNQVEIENTQVDILPPSGPSLASRNIGVYTRLISQGCEMLKKKRFREPLPIQLKRSFRQPPSRRWDKESMEGTPFTALSWGAAAVEVEVDPVSLQSTIKNLWLGIDGGKILHRKLADSTMESAVLQVMGWIKEEYLPMQNGQVTATGYRNFRIPGIEAYPAMELFFQNAESRQTPRGIGSLPFHTIPAAYAEALSQATGCDFPRLPITPRLIQSYWEEP